MRHGMILTQWIVAAVLVSIFAPQSGAELIPVDFSSLHNQRLQNASVAVNAPEGELTLGGVPFDIPVGGLNVWAAGGPNFSGGDDNNTIWTLDVPVNIPAVTTVFGLMNTAWGSMGLVDMTVEFFGSDGAFFSKDLIGNNDIRDMNTLFNSNINGVTTIEVFRSGRFVYDMVIFDLPIDFHDETLSSIRVTTERVIFLHSGVVSGLTVQTVPEPTTATLLMGLGVLGMATRRRACA